MSVTTVLGQFVSCGGHVVVMESTVEKKGTSISERLLREENIRLLEETRFCIDHDYIFKCEAKAAYGVIVRWPSSDRK